MDEMQADMHYPVCLFQPDPRCVNYTYLLRHSDWRMRAVKVRCQGLYKHTLHG